MFYYSIVWKYYSFLLVKFIHEFILHTLKSNRNVRRGLITACVKLGGIRQNYAVNIDHIPFLTHDKFSKFYGFTEEEVKLLLDKLKMLDKFDSVWSGTMAMQIVVKIKSIIRNLLLIIWNLRYLRITGQNHPVI